MWRMTASTMIIARVAWRTLGLWQTRCSRGQRTRDWPVTIPIQAINSIATGNKLVLDYEEISKAKWDDAERCDKETPEIASAISLECGKA